MPASKDIFGTTFKNGSAILLARILDSTGANAQQSGVTAIKYSIYELDACWPDHLAVVVGHDGVSLVVADVIFDTLKTDCLWTVDEVGYNFRHEIDFAATEAFPKAGVAYQVHYELTSTTGQKAIICFQLRVI